MGLFDGLFGAKKPAPQEPGVEALLAVLNVHPTAWVCIEPKPPGTSKLLSAAVLIDRDNRVGVCFVIADMSWLSPLNVKRVTPEPWIEIGRLDQPLLIRHGDTQWIQHQFTGVRLLLERRNGSATYIAFPWWPEHFGQVHGVDRWIVWSFANEIRRDPAHYWGFGSFGSQDDFEKFIGRITKPR